jgi:hypothetical protein
MEPERRNRILLAILGVVLVVIIYRAWQPAAVSAPQTSNVRGGDARPGSLPAPAGAPDVRLEALEAERPSPGGVDRNLFRFGTRPSASPRSAAPVATPGAIEPPPPPPGPPPEPGSAVAQVPPITLKFIGIVEAPVRGEKLAILSDGRFVHYGHEGDTIEGRYRIVRIGAESIEMTHLDGRGRQTIRLSGS